MGIDYNKAASKADYQEKNPFHDHVGDFLIVIQDMTAKENRKEQWADVCNWKIVKVLRSGDPSLEGAVRCRRRLIATDGTMSELQNRLLVGLSMGKRLRAERRDPHFEFPKASWNGDLIKGAHETNGKDIAGYPIVISCENVDTKSGGKFLAINYRYPSARDLEGITLDESGRVTE